MGLFDRLTRKRQDAAPKRTTSRGRGPGRTRQTRVDDLEQVRGKRRPQGVTSPIKDAAKSQKSPTTSKVAAPGKTPTNVTKGATSPTPTPQVFVESNEPKLTKKPQVTGAGDRNVSREGPSGPRTRANVTREQLKKTGLSLRDYLNFMDKNDRRPRSKADSEAAKKLSAAFDAKKAKKPVKKAMGGGMMKSKMKAKGMKAGGKMKSKGYSAGGKMKAKGMKAGGKMKAKGMAVGGPLKKAPEGNTGLKKLPKQVRNKMGFMAKGGMMKTKGYSKGGAAGGKKQKVRGAGIARKGVRPAKIR